MKPQDYEYVLKCIMVGDASVGKTSALKKFTSDVFSDKYDVTIGVEFADKRIQVRDKRIKLQIWDTAGQDTYRALTRSFIRNTAIAFIFFDITCQRSFASVANWIRDCADGASPSMLQVLVGNKLDRESERQVPTRRGREFSEMKNMLFFEVSAKDGDSVNEMFESVSAVVCDKISSGQMKAEDPSLGIKIGRFKGNRFKEASARELDSENLEKRSCCFYCTISIS